MVPCPKRDSILEPKSLLVFESNYQWPLAQHGWLAAPLNPIHLIDLKYTSAIQGWLHEGEDPYGASRIELEQPFAEI